MSQILDLRTKNTLLHQDVILNQNDFFLRTNVNLANCYVCGKGLQDGYSLTAKRTSSETILLCNKHYS